MPRLFWANFDFEHELAIGDGWELPEKLHGVAIENATAFLPLCDSGDRIVVPSRNDAAHPAVVARDRVESESEYQGIRWTLIPWGVTESLRRLASRRGWKWNQPDPALVRCLNDRATSFDWEARTGTLPPGAALLRSRDEIAAILAERGEEDWLLKSRFGMSGRERIPLRGGIGEGEQNWIDKRLDRDGALFLEPRLVSRGEVGLQWDVPTPADGEPVLLALMELHTAPHGEFVASRLLPDPEQVAAWQPAIDVTRTIACEFQQSGYFGPLGIDAMRYDWRGEQRIRPVQDINARWTMGRLAWERVRWESTRPSGHTLPHHQTP